jgi:hypothetical protein
MLKRLSFIAGAGLMAASMWVWVQDITIAHQEKEAAERGIPRGNLSDLYPRWLGTRELLLHGRDPYTADITREIQIGYYGRPIDPSRPNDPKDQQAFAYPLYIVFVLAPTVQLPFPLVQRGFLWVLMAVTAASVLLWLRALQWQISISAKLVAIILVLGCFPVIQGFKLQQLTLLVAVLLAGSVAAIARQKFVLAGILIALASIKPQLVLLISLWLLIWVLGNWRLRQRLFWSFVGSMAVLFAGSEALMPGWIREFRNATEAYYRYTGGGKSVLDIALTPTAGRLISAILAIFLLVFLWQVRRESEGSNAFHWSLAAVLATTLVIIPMFAPYNQVLLLPAFMLVTKTSQTLWRASRMSRFFVLVTGTSILWPWVATVALAIALFLLPADMVERAWPLPLVTTLMIPVSLVCLIFVARTTLCPRDTPE